MLEISGSSLMNANFENANIQNTNFDGVMKYITYNRIIRYSYLIK